MLTVASKVEVDVSIVYAEASAFLFGISIVLDSGLRSLLVEYDCLSVINLINQSLNPMNELGPILEDIALISGRGGVSTFSFVPRLANREAHTLAKFGRSLSDVFVCLEDYLSFLADIILDDARSSFSS
ncbi:hypothetical protein ACOSP7_022155 [Xanthoceras sorbifolium]